MSLSCPEGSELVGDPSRITCSPSLQWSPSPAGARCKAGARRSARGAGGAETSRTECVDLSLSSGTTVSTPLSGLGCKLWETEGRAKCVCLMAFQCP